MSDQLRALTMPKWGLEMTEGTLTEWLVKEGEAYKKGQPIAVVETEKIANEMEAERDGVMCRHVAGEGDTLPVAALLAVVGAKKTKAAEVDAFLKDFKAVDTGPRYEEEATEEKVEEEAPEVEAEPEPRPKPEPEPSEESADIDASPAARARARELGVALGSVTGSGRGGRITRQDVEQVAHKGKAAPSPSGRGSTVTNISPLARELARLLDVDLEAINGSGRGGRITRQDVEQTAAKAGKADADIAAASDDVRASPLARRVAEARGVALDAVRGSGPRGRVLRQDVESAPRVTVTGEAGYEARKMSPMRRAIAKRLVESKQTIPHFYLTIDVELDELLSIRRQLNGRTERESGAQKLSVNDFLIRAVGLALMRERDANVQLVDGEIRYFDRADVSVAVAVDGGLVTPVVRGADLKGVDDIAADMADLAARARDGKLGMEEMKGGSFSLSNLGMYGIRQFDAVINPPQGAILAVGRAEKRQLVRDDDRVEIRTCLTATLSCDHRVIDGAIGARFLAAFRDLIENPATLIV